MLIRNSRSPLICLVLVTKVEARPSSFHVFAPLFPPRPAKPLQNSIPLFRVRFSFHVDNRASTKPHSSHSLPVHPSRSRARRPIEWIAHSLPFNLRFHLQKWLLALFKRRECSFIIGCYRTLCDALTNSKGEEPFVIFFAATAGSGVDFTFAAAVCVCAIRMEPNAGDDRRRPPQSRQSESIRSRAPSRAPFFLSST